MVELTRNDITGIHGILVFDESETIHELDLGDFSGAMSVEMGLDISFGGYQLLAKLNTRNPAREAGRRMRNSTYHFEEGYPGISG